MPKKKAGTYVREEMHALHRGKRGIKSPEQAVAIGLSRARRAGVRVPPKGAKSRRGRFSSR